MPLLLRFRNTVGPFRNSTRLIVWYHKTGTGNTHSITWPSSDITPYQSVNQNMYPLNLALIACIPFCDLPIPRGPFRALEPSSTLSEGRMPSRLPIIEYKIGVSMLLDLLSLFSGTTLPSRQAPASCVVFPSLSFQPFSSLSRIEHGND